MEERECVELLLFDLMAWLVIPTYTLLFACGAPWLTTNFSVLGSFADRRLAFLIWGILVGCYFNWAMERVLPRLRGGHWARRGKDAALVLLALSVLTPYLPEETPFRAFLHVVFAAISTVLLLVVLLVLMVRWYRRVGRPALFYLLWVVGTCVVALVLLAWAGIVSSALEIFLTVSLTLLMWVLLRGKGVAASGGTSSS